MKKKKNQNQKNNSNKNHYKPPSHIHDQFFRFTLSKPNAVKRLFEGFFPDVYKKIDFSSLKQLPDSFTDKKLKLYFSDLVYSAKLDNASVKLSILFEHKSFKDPNVYRQLLQYILNIWNAEQKNNLQFSIPIPVLIYTGKNIWKPKTLKEFFSQFTDDKQLLDFIPQFKILFLNISELSDQQILELTKDVYLYFWMMTSKYIHQNPDDIIKVFRLHFNYLIDIFSASDITEALKSSLHYLSFFDNFAEEQVKNEIMEIFTDAKPLPNSIYVELFEKPREEGRKEGLIEGREKGRKEGREEGKLEDAYNFYKLGVPMEIIVKATGLPEQKIWDYIKKQQKKEK